MKVKNKNPKEKDKNKNKKKPAKDQDFQKKKVKVGKKIPKAQNETATAFKTRAIVIKEQLRTPQSSKDDKISAAAISKYSLQELLAHSHNYNVNRRTGALTSIRDLLAKKPNLIESNLSKIIDHLVDMCVDREPDVRRAWMRVTKVILSFCKKEAMQPYAPILCAQLKCAMTHINEGIRRDSLKLLDTYLECSPHIVTSVDTEVLSCFISLISRNATFGQGSEAVEKRILMSDPASTMASHQWYLNVLQRLKRFLQILCSQDASKNRMALIDSDKGVPFNTEQPTHRQPFMSHDSQSSLGLGYIKPRITFKKSDDEVQTIDDISLALFPLMVDIWTEIAPMCQQNTDDPTETGLLDIDGFNILDNILSVFKYLTKLTSVESKDAEECEFDDILNKFNKHRATSSGGGETSNEVEHRNLLRFEKDFYRRFVQHFPYDVNLGKKKDQNDKLQTNVVALNLTLCDIVTYFLAANEHTNLPYGSKLVNYIMKEIQSSPSSLSSDQIRSVLDITRQLWHCNRVQNGRNTEYLKHILKGIYSFYQRDNKLTPEKRLINELFSSLLAEELPCQHNPVFDNTFNRWQVSLPRLLAYPKALKVFSADVSLLVPTIAQSIQKSNCVLAQKQLQKYFKQILEKVPQYPENVQRKVLSLVLCMDVLEREHYQALAYLSHHPSILSLSTFTFLIEIVIQKQMMDKPDYFTLSSFLLSLLSGCTQSDLTELNVGVEENTTNVSHSLFLGNITPNKWLRATHGTEICCQHIIGLEEHCNVISMLFSGFNNICNHHKVLPLYTVYNFIQSINLLHQHYNGALTPAIRDLVTDLALRVVIMITQLMAVTFSDVTILNIAKSNKKKDNQLETSNEEVAEAMEVDGSEMTDIILDSNVLTDIQNTCLKAFEVNSDSFWSKSCLMEKFFKYHEDCIKTTNLDISIQSVTRLLSGWRQQDPPLALPAEGHAQLKSLHATYLKKKSKIEPTILAAFLYECKLLMI